MKILHILALLLTTSIVWGGTLGNDPRWSQGETVRIPTGDHRIKQIRFFKVGANGVGGVTGDVCPPGEVWKITSAGIFTDDGEYREWMMQVIVMEPFGSGVPHPFGIPGKCFDFMLVPQHRQPGFSMGTPTLATDRDIIIMPGEALCARAGGILPDRQMGMCYVGFAFDEELLPQLLGVGADCSSTPALNSINREIKSLEKSKKSLQ